MLNYGIVTTHDVICAVCRRSPVGRDLEVVTIRDYLNISVQQEFNYFKCPCGVYYLRNQPDEDQIPQIYTDNYEAYNKNSGIVARLKAIRMRSVLKPLLVSGRQSRILDYGCGSGEFISSISELVDVPIIGYDIKEPTGNIPSNMIFVGSEKEIDAHGQFDLIFSFQVIEHVVDPGEFLDSLKGRLSTNGKLVLETPGTSGILFTKYLRIFWGGWHAPRHFVLFNRESLIDLCLKRGFDILSFEYIPSPFQWIESIRAMLPLKIRQSNFLSLKNTPLVALVYLIDNLLILARFRSSNMKVVLRNSSDSA